MPLWESARKGIVTTLLEIEKSREDFKKEILNACKPYKNEKERNACKEGFKTGAEFMALEGLNLAKKGTEVSHLGIQKLKEFIKKEK